MYKGGVNILDNEGKLERDQYCGNVGNELEGQNDMQPKVKIIAKSEAYPYNMSAWCLEKSERVLKSSTDLLEMINNGTVLFKDQDSKEYFNMAYLEILQNIVNLYGFFCGALLDKDYSDLILEKGIDGLEEVMVEFGQLKETTKQTKARRLKDLIDNLKFYLNEEKFNRTLIHEVLRKYRNDSKLVVKEIRTIEENIEKVSMGEMRAIEFINIANFIIEELENQLII